MGAAFGWGALAASSLVIGALIALRFQIGLRTIGLVMGFGAGVLISAVAFDLIQEAADKSSGHGSIAVGIFAGYAVFYGGDRLIDRLGGGDRKDATGDQQSGSALAIVLGTVLDGIPESMVIGLTIFEGGAVGAAYLAAVFISNLPESISSTTGLASGGWKKSRILWMWIGIALVSGLASLAGYGLFRDSSPDTVAVVLVFAAGAILTMLANTMMPEAFEHGGKLVGSSPRSASRSPTRSTPSVEVYELNTPRAAHHIGALPKPHCRGKSGSRVCSPLAPINDMQGDDALLDPSRWAPLAVLTANVVI